MKKSFRQQILLIILLGLFIPSLTFAVWWNPLTWKIFSRQRIIPVKVESTLVVPAAPNPEIQKPPSESLAPKGTPTPSPKINKSPSPKPVSIPVTPPPPSLPSKFPISEFYSTTFSDRTEFVWNSTGTDGVILTIPCSTTPGVYITEYIGGTEFLCGGSRKLSSIGAFSLKFKNITNTSLNITAFLTPVVGGVRKDSLEYISMAELSIPSPTSPIAVISPNGGEQWKIGSTYRILWKSSGNPVSIWVKGSSDRSGLGTSLSSPVTSFTTSNPGYYDWTIPSTLTSGSNYKIEVLESVGLKSAWSVNYFSIVE